MKANHFAVMLTWGLLGLAVVMLWLPVQAGIEKSIDDAIQQVISFSATPDNDTIRVEWETATEIDILGFNLYRAESLGDPPVQLNGSLIPSQSPGSPTGATYEFQDASVQAGVTYHYWLEEIAPSSSSTFYGPVSATALPSPTCPQPLSGISITGPTAGYTDTLYTFTAVVTPSDATEPITYTWSPEPYSNQGTASANYQWTTPDIYTITLKAENCGSVFSDTQEIVIHVANQAITGLSITSNSPSELGQPTAFTATVESGSNITYTWAFGDGQDGVGVEVSHIYPTVNVYTTIVTASNSVSKLTATTTVTITDALIAGLVAVNDSPTSLGDTTTLTATVTAGSNITYTWALGDGQGRSGNVTDHPYPDAGVYTAVVTASNSVSKLTATTTVTIARSSFYVYLPLAVKSY